MHISYTLLQIRTLKFTTLCVNMSVFVRHFYTTRWIRLAYRGAVFLSVRPMGIDGLTFSTSIRNFTNNFEQELWRRWNRHVRLHFPVSGQSTCDHATCDKIERGKQPAILFETLRREGFFFLPFLQHLHLGWSASLHTGYRIIKHSFAVQSRCIEIWQHYFISSIS